MKRTNAQSSATFSIRACLALSLIAGGAVSVAFTGGCNSKSAAATGAGGTTSDRTVAKKMSFDITTTASGELDARNKVELRSKLERQSTIVKIIEEGKRVTAGEVLVQLNGDELQTQINDETLQVESAKSQLVGAENAYLIQINENDSRLRDARLKIELADLALAHWMEGDVKIKRQENDLNVSKATLEVERLADKYIRSQELLAAGFLSKDECDRDEVTYIEAGSRWVTTRLQSEVYEKYQFPKEEKEKQSALDEAKAALERAKLNADSELASKDSARKNQHQQLSIREQKLTKLKEQLESCTMKAPKDGLVVYSTSLESGWRFGGDNTMQIGSQVYPNQLLIALPDTTDMVASIRVQESLAGRIKPGQEVSVKVEAVGGRVFAGKVETISVLAESGGWRDPNLREYTVKVSLDLAEVKDQLKPAMRCEARVTLGHVDDALGIPVQAVFQDGPVRYVYREEGGKFKKAPVKLGRRSDTHAEIVAGIDDGKTVLLREPAAGEVIASVWDKDQLLAAGYKIGENGEPLGEGAMPGGPGGKPGGGPKIATVKPGAPAMVPTSAKVVEGGDAVKVAENPSEATGEKLVEGTKPADGAKPADSAAAADAKPVAADDSAAKPEAKAEEKKPATDSKPVKDGKTGDGKK